ncbi:hypothetical protein RJ639_032432, partial [Escallonia herrerae]
MRTSYHSVHEPMCGICRKHCRSLESLREHLIGPLPKAECERIFKDQGCDICLNIFSSRGALRTHRESCQLSRGNAGLLHRMANLGIHDDLRIDNNSRTRVVALACKMVGGGSDGSLDLCARVCLTDEYENILFHTYVKPHLPITNYRYETTGIRPEFLRNAMPLRDVQRKIQDFLCNGEPVWKIRSKGGKARILVGHGLDHDLKNLEVEYPTILIRQALPQNSNVMYNLFVEGYSKIPSIDENKQAQQFTEASNKSIPWVMVMKHHVDRYDIQTGIQDPCEDCIATMRLYIRMRSQPHKMEEYPLATDPQNRKSLASWRQSELERMSPDDMLEISRSDYYC